MAKKTITGLLNKIDNELTMAYQGVEEYATELESTWVIERHLGEIGKLVEQLKEMI